MYAILIFTILLNLAVCQIYKLIVAIIANYVFAIANT